MPMSPDTLMAYIEDTFQTDQKITLDSGLFSTGLLDSVAMLQVITFIEEKTGLTVQADEVTLENFDTVERIMRMVGAKVTA